MQVLRGSSSSSAGAWASLAGPLSKVINDGLTKAAQRAEAVSALLAANLIAVADAKSDAAFAAAKTWEKAGLEGSPLLQPSQLSKAAVADALPMVYLAQALLLKVQRCSPLLIFQVCSLSSSLDFEVMEHMGRQDVIHHRPVLRILQTFEKPLCLPDKSAK